MKNLFKRREKKDQAKPDPGTNREAHVLAPVQEEHEVLELQAHGEFLETDEDLGYC